MTWGPPVLVLLAALGWWWPPPRRASRLAGPADGRGDGGDALPGDRWSGRPLLRRAPGGVSPIAWVSPVGRGVEALRGHRQTERAERDLLGVLEALAASLRSGATPRAALAEAAEVTTGPLRSDLSAVGRRLAMGETTADALASWSARRPLPGVRLVVAVLSLGTRTGGDLARAVDDVAATERHRRATREEVRSLSAQARLSAVVVAVAPLAFTALAALADPGVLAFLLGTPAGWACLVGGGSLDLAGAAWMRAITRSVG